MVLSMSDRLIREIEDILERAESSASDDDSRTTLQKYGRESWFLRLVRNGARLNALLKPSRVMLAGITLLLVAVLLNTLIPGRVHLLVWAGLVLFVVAYGLFFVNPSGVYEKRWRGRLVEDRGSWLDRLRRRLRR